MLSLNMSSFVKTNWLILSLFFIFLVTVFVFNFSIHGEQQFSYLAKSFLQGKTYFLEPPDGTWADATPYNGHYYYPPGPFPIILLMPFVFVFNLFNVFFYQGYLQFFLVIAVFIVIYKLSLIFKYSAKDALFLSFAFCFASPFLGVAMWPWRSYFGHVITVLLIFTSLLEFYSKKRYFIIGTLLAFATATRFPLIFGLIFFILPLLRTGEPRKIFQLLVPVFLTLFLLGLYNYINYGNFLETGYSTEISFFPSFLEAMKYGVLSIRHLPTNIYYAFLSGPLPINRPNTYVLEFPFIKANQYGMSLFLTSPYLFLLFKNNLKDFFTKNIFITCLLVSLPNFLLYATGFRQFGYRYSLDFLPFLFLLIMKRYQNTASLSTAFKTVVILSSIFNYYLFLTFISY